MNEGKCCQSHTDIVNLCYLKYITYKRSAF
jgi:hypothetical protein